MTGFSAAVRTTIRQRADGWCERCGLQRGTEMHHRRTRGMGGSKQEDTNTASNALHLCSPCHTYITEHPRDAYNHGWSVLSHQNPADIPVEYRGDWVYLDSLGNLQPIEEVI